MSTIKFKVNAKTDKGSVREQNEDNYIVCPDIRKGDWFFKKESSYDLGPFPCLFAVADGMGGHGNGQIASAMAIEILQNHSTTFSFHDLSDYKVYFNELFWKIQQGLIEASNKDKSLKGMGTTLVVALLDTHNYHVAWIGDSRAYIVKDLKLRQITTDHTMLEKLLDEGKIQKEHIENENISRFSHVLTKCLSTANDPQEYDLISGPLNELDSILLCSDGLSGVVNETQILDIINNSNFDSIPENLILEAIKAGGPDNITAVFIKLDQLESAKSSTELSINETIKITRSIPDSERYDRITKSEITSKIHLYKLKIFILVLIVFSLLSLLVFAALNKTGKIDNILDATEEGSYIDENKYPILKGDSSKVRDDSESD